MRINLSPWELRAALERFEAESRDLRTRWIHGERHEHLRVHDHVVERAIALADELALDGNRDAMVPAGALLEAGLAFLDLLEREPPPAPVSVMRARGAALAFLEMVATPVAAGFAAEAA